jgi:hypothetical protein
MSTRINPLLAAAFVASCAIALSNPTAAWSQYGDPYGWRSAYVSYGGYYGSSRYSGPYRTDSAPLTGGGY